MKKKLIGIFICTLLIATALPVTGTIITVTNCENKSVSYDLLDGGWLEERDGVEILFINGSYYEMGYQHGYLLKDEIQENIRAFIKYAEELTSYETLLEMWNTTKQYIPSCYTTEMQGIADGANASLEKLAISYMTILQMDMQCFSYAAWSEATENGRLYHIRSLDFPLIIKDPVTGKYIQENSVLIVRKPDDGLKSIVPSMAGWINFYEGINEKQVSIGVQVCWSSDQTLKGIPVQFRVQKILDSAKDADDAINIMTSNKTLGWNFIISDAKTRVGYAVETTANHTYVGSWNNSVEEKHPFWKIKNIVRRTNFFIHPTLAATQRTRYNPGGIIGFLKLFTGDSFFPLWRKYKSMSQEIQRNWGDIDLNSSISLLRKVYTGKTDLFMFIFVSLNKRGILSDFHQWSACPETGDFVISFADAESYAHENQLHYFNINGLFETDHV
ncbi:Acyl-coenzyme A:6-aminopenicillanic acid acyl-transferase [Thermoplasmatales archaeon SCGC AB-540-F20]|nr:Acyl-coenzyme A:6-aminopenicillanic acid acyl-transferase [Thermoplasmatales archaeon SCGC AB-540-F20]